MNRYFVTSDIHGFLTPLKKALKEKGFDQNNPEHILLLLGDVFDRGYEAVKTLKYLNKLKKQGRLILVRGNHEDLMYDCLKEIVEYRLVISSRHYHNGTVGTIAQFADDLDIAYKLEHWQTLSSSDVDKINKNMKPWKKFVEESVNYVEIGDYIFVHGWIPTIKEENAFMDAKLNYLNDWRNLPSYAGEWKSARWTGFVDAYKNKCFEPGKTIVCGHWHCSAYWGDIKQERKPFPEKNRKDWQKSFEPAITSEFIAIDACTAYSGIVNMLVFEEDSDNFLKLC